MKKTGEREISLSLLETKADLILTIQGSFLLFKWRLVYKPMAVLRCPFDHIFPKAEFSERKLRKERIPADKIMDFLENFNYIGYLQLLEGLANTSKNDKNFKKWFEDNKKQRLHIARNIGSLTVLFLRSQTFLRFWKLARL